jgi:hypothetical protein
VGTDRNANGGNEFFIANDFNATVPFVISGNGYVGIGNASPAAGLHVNGAIVSTEVVVPTGGTADMATANQVVFQSVGGTTLSLSNMVAGGQYRVIIEDTAQRMYTFSTCSTSYFNPPNGNTTTGTKSIYTITYSMPGKCYIDWKSGY